MTKKITVKQASPEEIPVEVLADSILKISQGIRALRKGRLNDNALFLLIQHAAPTKRGAGYQRVPISEIKKVFDGIDALEATYLKKRKP